MKNVFTGGTDGENMLREAVKALEGDLIWPTYWSYQILNSTDP